MKQKNYFVWQVVYGLPAMFDIIWFEAEFNENGRPMKAYGSAALEVYE